MNRSSLHRSLSGFFETVKFSISFLSKEDQIKYLAGISLNLILNLMDILGIFLLGLFGTLAIRGIQSQPQGDTVTGILSFLGLNNFSFQVQAFTISSLAVLILTSKSYFSLVINRKIFNFLALRSARVSSRIFGKVYLSDLLLINKISFQELRHSTNSAIFALVSGILGAAAVLVADLMLLIFLCIAIGLFDVLSLFFILTLFGLSASLLLRKQFKKAKSIGRKSTNFSIAADGLLHDSINLYREFYVRNKRDEVVNNLQNLKEAQAQITGQQSFLPNVGKYIIESTVLIGVIVVSGLQFMLHDANQAVAGVAIFISSAGRIAPALMRIQQNLTQMNISLGETLRVRSLIDRLNADLPTVRSSEPNNDSKIEPTKIIINNLNFKFSETSNFALKIEKLVIESNSAVALVGPSGAGKTSLVDLILGVLPSTEGSVTIGGLFPQEAIGRNPKLISYVPQRVQLLDTSIYENIAMTKERNELSDTRMLEVLKMSDLQDWVKSLPEGLETQMGSLGVIASGGQAQRIGLARAFFVNPKILILDEATSAIDYESEEKIRQTLERVKGTMTVLTIAHRLSTVKSSDLIIIMQDGTITAQGDFQSLTNNNEYFKNILKSLIQ